MSQLIDLTGKVFSRLTVTRRDESRPRGKNHNAFWTCQCVCGGAATVNGYDLSSGHTQSCGCLRRELVRVLGKKNVPKMIAASKRHGAASRNNKSVEYRAWQNAKNRCLNAHRKDYGHYGGRGITMCPQWLHSFESFLADVGYRPGPGLSLDRIDNDGNYEPGNCRWATKSVQVRNQRRWRNA